MTRALVVVATVRGATAEALMRVAGMAGLGEREKERRQQRMEVMDFI